MTAPEQPAAEHAAIVRRFLGDISPCGRFVTVGSPSTEQAFAALDALVAERDEARKRNVALETQGIADALGFRDTRLEAAEARVTELEAQVKICAHCASGYVPNPGDEHKEGRAGCRRVEALDAALTACEEAIRHYANRDHWNEVTPGPETNTAGYLLWEYDGGNELPWTVASAALAATGKEDTDE